MQMMRKIVGENFLLGVWDDGELSEGLFCKC